MMLNRRDIIVLAVFIPCVALAAGLRIRSQVAASREPAEQPTRAKATPAAEADVTGRMAELDLADPSHYAEVIERDLFGPIVKPAAVPDSGACAAPPAESGASRPEPTPGERPEPGHLEDDGPPAGTPSPTPTPARVELSLELKAVVKGRHGVEALVAERGSRDARWIFVGQQAFGYRLRYATSLGAVFEKDGQYYVADLRASAKAKAEEPAGSEEGSSGSTPEQGASESKPAPSVAGDPLEGLSSRTREYLRSRYGDNIPAEAIERARSWSRYRSSGDYGRGRGPQ